MVDLPSDALIELITVYLVKYPILFGFIVYFSSGADDWICRHLLDDPENVSRTRFFNLLFFFHFNFKNLPKCQNLQNQGRSEIPATPV